MTADRSMDRARSLFDRMLEQPLEQRAPFLDRECGNDDALRAELASLLRLHEDSERRFVEPVRPAMERAGDTIGHYRLVQPLGEGGFGTVWLAEQHEPVQRQVALKVLKPGMDSTQVLARFEAERQALARMEHPNIAQVFDGGSTALGRPYFVMELVRGVPITRYCDEVALPPHERLRLFVDVCQAVQHAHHKGVIHRDLKPGNVLVVEHEGRPVAKVIDFGIAKAIRGRLTEHSLHTELRQLLGTPEYMAPEQAEATEGDVDTRADVYSLGVLLYELMTGTRPFEFRELLQAGLAEMLRTIREVQPHKPSTRISTLGDRLDDVARHRRVPPRALASLLRGDLDWIVMRSLAKERDRRYATPAALAEDVQRHLRHEPVEARPPGRWYRLQKYVRRHRLGVAAGAAITLSLLAGALAAAAGWLRARDEASAARIAAARAGRVVALLEEMLGSADPYALPRPGYTVRQLLDEFAQRFTGQLQDEPEVEAGLRATLAGSYAGLGLAGPAWQQAQRATELRLRLYGEHSEQHADSLLLAASCRRIEGRYDEAVAAGRDALGILRALGPGHDAKLLDTLVMLGSLEWCRHRGDAAQEVIREAIALAEDRGDAATHATALELLAAVFERQDRPLAAEALLQEALERRGVGAAASLELAGTWGKLAAVLQASGRLSEATECSEKALRLSREAAGESHPSVAHHLMTLGSLQLSRGDHTLAMQTLADAVAAQRAALGDDSPELATGLRLLAHAQTACWRLADAELGAREALRIDTLTTDVPGPAAADDHLGLAGILLRAGRLEEAQHDAELALTIRTRWLGEPHGDVAVARCELARILDQRGQAAEAEALLRAAEAALTATPWRAWDLAVTRSGLVRLLLQSNRADEAAPLAQAALDAATAMHGEHHLRSTEMRLLRAEVAAAMAPASPERRLEVEALRAALSAAGETPEAARQQALLGRSQLQRGALAEAEQNVRGALERQQRLLPPDHLDIATTTNDLGLVLEARGRAAEAEPLLQRSLAMYRQRLGEAHAWIASTLASLGKVWLVRGDVAAAERWYRESLAMWQRLPGDQELQIARCLHGIGDCKRLAGDVTTAIEYLQDALRIRREASVGPTPEIANNLNSLGLLLQGQGDAEGALRHLRDALETHRQLGSPHDTLWPTLINVGVVLEQSGRAAEAEQLYRQEMETMVAGEHDAIDRGNVLGQLGNNLLVQQRPADAEPLLAECLQIREEHQPRDWRRWVAASQLGQARLLLGKYDEAEQQLVAAAETMRPPPTLIDRRRTAMARLIQLYELTQRPAEAEAWRQRLAKLPGAR